MSYILEALKRAESERSHGAVPGLHAQPGALAPPAAGRSLMGWWVAGAGALILSGAMVLVFGPGSARDPETAVVPAPVAPGVPAPVVRAAPVPTVRVPTPAPAQVDPQAPPQPPLEHAETLAAARVASVTDPVPSREVRALRKGLTEPGLRAEPGRGVQPGAAASAAASSPDERVYAEAELPAQIRSQLPTLRVEGATYSDSPASRMLMLNGQLYHEGDKLAPELTLQQIQLRRAVLSFRGYRYAISY